MLKTNACKTSVRIHAVLKLHLHWCITLVAVSFKDIRFSSYGKDEPLRANYALLLLDLTHRNKPLREPYPFTSSFSFQIWNVRHAEILLCNRLKYQEACLRACRWLSPDDIDLAEHDTSAVVAPWISQTFYLVPNTLFQVVAIANTRWNVALPAVHLESALNSEKEGITTSDIRLARMFCSMISLSVS